MPMMAWLAFSASMNSYLALTEDLLRRRPLADLVLDAHEPWWRRMACARALTERIPDGRAAALLECVRDDRVTVEIRRALLGALSVALAENLVRAGQAACWYSLRIPAQTRASSYTQAGDLVRVADR
jgi:hypothetical protein